MKKKSLGLIGMASLCLGIVFSGCGDMLDGIRLADCVTEATSLQRCRDAGQAGNVLCVDHAMKTARCQDASIIDYQKVAASEPAR